MKRTTVIAQAARLESSGMQKELYERGLAHGFTKGYRAKSVELQIFNSLKNARPAWDKAKCVDSQRQPNDARNATKLNKLRNKLIGVRINAQKCV